MQTRALHIRGVSLLELLVYVAILSIVVIVLASALISFIRAKARVEAIVEVDQALRFAGEYITRDVERATTLTDPAVAGTSTTLVLAYASSSISYALSGGTVTRTIGTTTETLTSDRVYVTAMTFVRTSNYEAELPATSTGIRWILRAQHRFLASEYAYDGAREGAAEVRNHLTP